MNSIKKSLFLALLLCFIQKNLIASIYAPPTAQEALQASQSGKTVLAFLSSSCPVCSAVKQPLADAAKDARIKDINIIFLETDSFPELLQQFQVSSVPSFVMFKDGQIVGRMVGTEDPLKFDQEFIANVLSAYKQ